MTSTLRITAFFFFFLPAIINAQSYDNARFGKVSMNELQMTSYPRDTAAHAVVLFDKGKFDGNTWLFTRHTRIKILRPGGTFFANFQVRTPSRSNIDGITFNLDSGRVSETALSRENVFKEEIMNGRSIYKIFFPNVKPGSVIDLKYSFRGLPYDWYFQNRIPVAYSEIIVEHAHHVKFKKTMYGNQPVTSVDDIQWFVKDVPALQEEPQMAHYSNYLTHFRFDILSVGSSGVSSDWPRVGDLLWHDSNFGEVLENCPFLNAKAKEIKNSTASKQEKIGIAFDYIRENIKWNEWSSVFAHDSYWTNFTKNHSGNSADINLILVSILKKSGIMAYPAVLSTRENGFINKLSASMSSLDYVVAYVKDGDTEMILDATSKDVIPGVLPERVRNIVAFVIDGPDNGWWIDISGGKLNSKKQYIRLYLENINEPTADVTTIYEDYGYLQWIQAFDKHGSEQAYVQSRKADLKEAELTNCSVSLDRTKLKATEQVKVSLAGSDYVTDLGDEVVINPFIFMDLENPFRKETRSYPIDFITGVNRSVTATIKIPENYILRSVPDKISIQPERGGVRFIYDAGFMNGVLSIKCNLQIDKQIFSEDEYSDLRLFYTEMLRKLSEPIQLDIKK